jgi:succinate dehydrogenase / fumarate reductase cytochrome b subunit
MSERPLSPHLQVYRPMYTMVLSITHRATGVFLSAGTVLLAYWLMAAASGPDAYAAAGRVLAHPLTQLVLAGWVVAFWYHLFAGVRHLFWDAGLGFDRQGARRTGQLVVALALVASVVTLAVAWRQFGGGA